MRGDKVRRRQSTETLCCFTQPHPFVSALANCVCLFTEWLDLAEKNVHLFLVFVSLAASDFLHPCVSLLLSFSIHLLYVKVSFFGPPTHNSRVFWLITLGIFPCLNTLPLRRVFLDPRRAAQETVTLIMPVIGFTDAGAVIYMR